MADHFHLSKPYLSKYIKDKAGATFQDVVKNERLKRSKNLLRETNMTVEAIATAIGYDNVEHFNRLFKKTYGITPMQYKKEKSEKQRASLNEKA